ncbi:MAG: hypothetical protein AB8G99_14305 [Planctomycetaceae bacterium]
MNELIPAPEEDNAPSQVEVYEDLKRIGELEDQKQKIQAEIDEKTNGLRSALKHIDKGSLLYSMLSAALTPVAPAAKTAKKTTRKKATNRSRK